MYTYQMCGSFTTMNLPIYYVLNLKRICLMVEFHTPTRLTERFGLLVSVHGGVYGTAQHLHKRPNLHYLSHPGPRTHSIAAVIRSPTLTPPSITPPRAWSRGQFHSVAGQQKHVTSQNRTPRKE